MKTTALSVLFAALLAASGFAPALAAPPAPPPKFEVLVAKGKSTKFNKTDYDNKTQNFQCKVTVRSKEFQRNFPNLRATLVVVGKQVNGDVRQLLDVATAEFSLPAKQSHVFEGHSVSLDFDDSAAAQYGIKYEGYALVIEDAAGATLFSEATKKLYLQDFPKLRALAVGTCFDPSLTQVNPPIGAMLVAPTPAAAPARSITGR